MPTSLIHFKVGNEYAKNHRQFDNSQFYLGLITPDTVNLHGFAEKKVRWAAHIRDKNLNTWKENIVGFYKNNLGKFDLSYIHGYLIHVLTDIIFDEINPNGIFKKIEEKYGKENRKDIYSLQMDLYECSQLDENWWEEVRQLLFKSEPENINNIPKEDIAEWKNQIVRIYDTKEKKVAELIDDNYIYEIYQALEKCVKDFDIL